MLDKYQLKIDGIKERINEKEGTSFFKEIKSEFDLSHIDNIILTGNGIAWNACLLAKYIIEEHTLIKTHLINAIDLNYRPVFHNKNSLFIAISDINESPEIVSAFKDAKNNGVKTMCLVNESTSDLCQFSDIIINTSIGNISNNNLNDIFINNVITLSLIALKLGRYKTISLIEGREIIGNIYSLPNKIKNIIEHNSNFKEIGNIIKGHNNIGILGNRYNYHTAKVAASLFSEICKIHTNVVYASEMKHGPITLVDEEMPFIVILCEESLFDKTIGNIQELRARRAKVILITDLDDDILTSICDHVIKLPKGAEMFSPILTIKAFQLITHYVL